VNKKRETFSIKLNFSTLNWIEAFTRPFASRLAIQRSHWQEPNNNNNHTKKKNKVKMLMSCRWSY